MELRAATSGERDDIRRLVAQSGLPVADQLRETQEEL